jgi:hypothetical protein
VHASFWGLLGGWWVAATFGCASLRSACCFPHSYMYITLPLTILKPGPCRIFTPKHDIMRCACVAVQECPVWAESGECEVNPGFMVGNKREPGACLASCARCDLLPDPTKTGGTSRKLKQ